MNQFELALPLHVERTRNRGPLPIKATIFDKDGNAIAYCGDYETAVLFCQVCNMNPAPLSPNCSVT